ncbi:MAG: TonB-dependent receptor domain-containing protein, partial [bacterium]
NGLQKWQSKISGTHGGNAYFINFTGVKSDGFREHAAARSTSLNAIGKHTISGQVRLTTVLNYFNAPYLLNPSSLSKTDAQNSPEMARFFVKQQGAGKKVHQGQGGVTVSYSDGKTNRFQATVYGVWRSLFNPIPGRIIDLNRAAWGIRTVFSQSFQTNNLNIYWKIGADYEAQKDKRQEFKNNGIKADRLDELVHRERLDAVQIGSHLLDQKEMISGIGPFAELEIALHTTWILTLGGRYDHYAFRVQDTFLQDGADDSGRRTMHQFSPAVGFAFRPHPLRTFYFNYGTAFQTPTTTELGNRTTGAGGFNPDLQPENINNLEFGIKGRWPKLRFDYEAAIYLLKIKNMLIPFQVQDTASEEIFFRNAGKAQNKGVELRLTAEIFAGLNATFAYTYMDFIFKNFIVETEIGEAKALVQLAGNKVPAVPPHKLYAGVVYEHKSGLFAEINLDWTDRYFANDSNGPAPGNIQSRKDFLNDSFTQVEMRIGFRRDDSGKGAGIFFGIDNILDKRYNGSIVPNAFGARFFEPAPGRTWYVGVSADF